MSCLDLYTKWPGGLPKDQAVREYYRFTQTMQADIKSPLMDKTHTLHEAALRRKEVLAREAFGTDQVYPLADALAQGDRILQEREHHGRNPLQLSPALDPSTAKADEAARAAPKARTSTLLTE